MTPITREIANNVLHFFRSNEGYPAGGFFHALYEAAARADRQNMDRLESAFPGEIGAFRLAVERADGMNQLRQIAAGA